MRTPRATLLRVGAAAACLFAGAVVRFGGHDSVTGDTIWRWGLGLLGALVVARTARGVFAGRFSADIVASLAIIVAFALDQSFAGLIIVIMQTGGEALELVAEGRASRALRDLETAAPRLAHRLRGDVDTDISVDQILVDDRLLVRPGEMVPCDGVVIAGASHVDASTLTGEPFPVLAEAGARLMSGAINLEGPLTMRATALAEESQYHRIVELVRTAQASKAPLQRLADRYAVWFTPLTIGICGLTYLVTHDPVRVLAVLVVATPCPLILATPIAIVAGINQLAKRHVVVRRGSALEQMSAVSTVVFDKTGTLTLGRPQVAMVHPATGFDPADVLRLAGAIEHGSGHLLARTLVEAATAAGGASPPATDVIESAGAGVTGQVEGHAVTVGAFRFVTTKHPASSTTFTSLGGRDNNLRAYVAIDGRAAAVIEYADRPRAGIARFLERLRKAGTQRIVLLSGDAQGTVDAIANELGIDDARGELLPEDKVAAIEALMRHGEHVVMLGDGTNDAPALSAATVGVALSAGGSGITAEAADAVILGDDPSRLADAIDISQRTMRIARQSIWGGLVCSGIAIGFAAFGMIPPAIGAILQEAVDIAVIANALRAAR